MVETMPTNQRDVFVEQRNNIELEFKCDYRFQVVPTLLEQPDTNDYLTDEESDDAGDFELKMPDLDELINQFETVDDTLIEFKEKQKEQVSAIVNKGFEPQARHDILSIKEEKMEMLNSNINKQRQQQISILPGMIQDLNEVTSSSKNKVYLR